MSKANRRTRLVLFNKPFNVLSQFTDNDANRQTLADYIDIAQIYPAGRLDRDSEGLMLLTNDGALQASISHPRHKMEKTYVIQVDGQINGQAIDRLQKGVELKDGFASALSAKPIQEPVWLWERDPPVRFRKNIPTSWLELTINEGRNRQVRRMSAKAGFPTLRLIRTRVGPWSLGSLKPGSWQEQQEVPTL